jgi:DNA-binding Lrp family transcriptional regulator
MSPSGADDDRGNEPTSGTFGFRLSSLGEPKRKGHAVVQAYILVQTEVGRAAAVAAEIAGIDGVTSAEDVTGPYDVIVRAEAQDVDQLGHLVVAQVQGVGGITRTLTCPVVHLPR